MQLCELKPILSTLVLPPTGSLLLLAFGYALARVTRYKRLGKTLSLGGFLITWLFSLPGVALLLNEALLTRYPATSVEQLKQSQVQAVIVLGGGVQADAAEYQNITQLSPEAAARLRYGAILARDAALPLGYSGGVGWNTVSKAQTSEAQAASTYLQSLQLAPARWLEGKSADTQQNASEMAKLLRPLGIERIAIVTHDWHMQRSLANFSQAGFTVTPAPVMRISLNGLPLLNWLPSAHAMRHSHIVLREALGLLVLRLQNLF